MADIRMVLITRPPCPKQHCDKEQVYAVVVKDKELGRFCGNHARDLWRELLANQG